MFKCRSGGRARKEGQSAFSAWPKGDVYTGKKDLRITPSTGRRWRHPELFAGEKTFESTRERSPFAWRIVLLCG